MYFGVTPDRTLGYKQHNTQQEDEGGNTQQSIEKVVNFKMDMKCKYNQNNSIGIKLLCGRIREVTEFAVAQTTIPTNIHTANRSITNIILMADKHNIPKGKMHNNCRLLPDHIICKITQRNNMKKNPPYDPVLKLLNGDITSDIHTHNKTYGRNI